MGKLEELKQLGKEFAELEKQAKKLAKPLYERQAIRMVKIQEIFETEYALIEEDINAIYDRQAEIEEKIEYLEDTMIYCEWCGKPVNELHKEAVDNGFDYCKECFEDFDTCETCGAIGQYGTNTEANNIYMCWECGVTYCDNCDEAHECPEEEEDE